MSLGSAALAAKIIAPPLADLPDWRVAEILNAPDPSHPAIVTLEQTLFGPAGIMAILGPERGADVSAPALPVLGGTQQRRSHGPHGRPRARRKGIV